MKKFRKPDGNRPKSGHGGSRPPQKGNRPHGQRPPPPRAQTANANNVPQGRCVVGIHAVTELLAVRPRAIEHFWMRENFEDHPALNKLHEEAERLGVRIKTFGTGTLDKIATANQGVLAFTQQEPEPDWQKLFAQPEATLVALDEVEDPHNLGAVLRTCWLFGAEAVLTPEHRAANLSPAVSKVAQGAAEHVPVVRDSALPQQLLELKKHGYWILGLSHQAKQNLYSFKIPEKVVWVLGSEASGLRKSVEGVCDDFIAIPQSNPAASYNVSVAAAVALAETFRQRQCDNPLDRS